MNAYEDDSVPISALQHLVFCERQAALIHVERVWVDNARTVHGRHMHRRVDAIAPRRERRGDTVILRGLWLRSERLGLIGRADAVEIHRVADRAGRRESERPLEAASVTGLPGRWRYHPVEYKRGRPKKHRADEVQLCAQAMCIEEMNRIRVASGSLYYGSARRRKEVEFDAELRQLVEDAACRMRSLIETGFTPAARFDKRCEHCSLAGVCLPAEVSRPQRNDLCSMIRDHLREESAD